MIQRIVLFSFLISSGANAEVASKWEFSTWSRWRPSCGVRLDGSRAGPIAAGSADHRDFISGLLFTGQNELFAPVGDFVTFSKSEDGHLLIADGGKPFGVLGRLALKVPLDWLVGENTRGGYPAEGERFTSWRYLSLDTFRWKVSGHIGFRKYDGTEWAFLRSSLDARGGLVVRARLIGAHFGFEIAGTRMAGGRVKIIEAPGDVFEPGWF